MINSFYHVESPTYKIAEPDYGTFPYCNKKERFIYFPRYSVEYLRLFLENQHEACILLYYAKRFLDCGRYDEALDVVVKMDEVLESHSFKKSYDDDILQLQILFIMLHEIGHVLMSHSVKDRDILSANAEKWVKWMQNEYNVNYDNFYSTLDNVYGANEKFYADADEETKQMVYNSFVKITDFSNKIGKRSFEELTCDIYACTVISRMLERKVLYSGKNTLFAIHRVYEPYLYHQYFDTDPKESISMEIGIINSLRRTLACYFLGSVIDYEPDEEFSRVLGNLSFYQSQVVLENRDRYAHLYSTLEEDCIIAPWTSYDEVIERLGSIMRKYELS